MPEWLAANLGTIIITLVLATAVTLVIVKMVREKKQGKSSCGGNCASCGCSCCRYSRTCGSAGKN